VPELDDDDDDDDAAGGPKPPNMHPKDAPRFSFRAKLISLMQSLEDTTNRYAAEFLYNLCEKDGEPRERWEDSVLLVSSSIPHNTHPVIPLGGHLGIPQ
jgi:hypothetical protein